MHINDSGMCRPVNCRLHCLASLHVRVQLSPEVNKAAQGVDLVVLEGMGRGIETNLNAEFKCDALNLGMVKHPEVSLLVCMRQLVCACIISAVL